MASGNQNITKSKNLLLYRYLKYRSKRCRKFLVLLGNSRLKIFCISFISVTLFCLFNHPLYLVPTVIFFIFLRNRNLFFVLIGVIFSILSFWNFNNSYLQEFQNYKGKTIIGNAIVVEVSQNDFNQEVILKTDELSTLIIAKLDKYPLLSLSSQILINGKLKEIKNFSDEFDYISFLKSKKIFLEFEGEYEIKSESKDIFINLKKEIEIILKQNFGRNESELLKGVLIGSPTFNEDFNNKLQNSGLSHIVSVSGYNFSILFSVLLLLCGVVNRRIILLIGIPIILMYLFIVGFENIPAQRAAIMILIKILSLIIGIRISNLNLILVTIVSILIEYPLYCTNISFLLSFSAFIALITLSESFKKILETKFKNKFNILTEIIATSLSVIVFTSFITIPIFKSFSTISIVLNILILPFIPFLMFLGLVFIILSYLELDFLIYILSAPLNLLLETIIMMIDITGGIDSKSILSILIGITSIFLLILFLIIYDIKKYKEKFL